MLKWIKNMWKKPKKPEKYAFPHNQLASKIPTTEELRTRATKLGWKLKETSIKKHTLIRIIASKEFKTIEVCGKNIDEAMNIMAKQIGIIR